MWQLWTSEQGCILSKEWGLSSLENTGEHFFFNILQRESQKALSHPKESHKEESVTDIIVFFITKYSV